MTICPFCYHHENTSVSTRPGKYLCRSNNGEARCKACTDLAELDAKIAEARQSLLDMQAQRLSVLSDVNRTHDLLGNTFPVEIISNIFQQCLPDVETLINSDDKMTASVPLRLSQVCRYWRTISHSISSLWNVMALYVEESETLYLDNICEVAQDWIDRSGDLLPIYIIIKVEGEHDSEEPKCLSTFQAATDHEQRLGYLHVAASTKVIRRLQALGGDLRRYRVPLSLGSSPSYLKFPSSYSTPLSFPLKVRRMKRILLEDIEVSIKKLTHVDMSTIYLGDAISLLCYAPNIISCKFLGLNTVRHSDGYPMPPSPNPPVAQQTLEELHLQSENGHCPSRIFAAFNFPSLKLLALETEPQSADRGHWRELFVALSGHIRRSDSQLQSISIKNISVGNLGNYMWITEVLRLLGPSLGSLDVETAYADSEDDVRLASIIGSMLIDFTSLYSIRFFVGDLPSIYNLNVLLSAASAITIPNGQELSITIWSCIAFIDDQTGDIDPRTLSYDNNEGALGATDIRNILSVMKHEFISTRIFLRVSAEQLTDITHNVIIGLRRALRRLKAEGKKKRKRS